MLVLFREGRGMMAFRFRSHPVRRADRSPSGSKNRPRRHPKLLTRGCVSFLFLLPVLAIPLPARAQSADSGSVSGADPVAHTKPAPIEPPTAEQRLPVVDLSDLPGLWPEDVVEAFPGKIDPLSPGDATEGAELLPTKGDATTDVYATGDGSGEHLALVQVEPHKELDPDGNWKETELAFETISDGWRYTDLSGLAFTFPKVLSMETPVVFEAGSGSMTSSPETTSEAVVEGTSITYPGAAGGNDLVYRATHLGVQEQIVLAKAPEDATFRFVVTTKGLSLALNPYGGVDMTRADGKPLGTIPAAVADDSSPDIASDTATYELTPLAEGATELAFVFDPGFFEKATYPVVVDPAPIQQVSPHRDGYVDQSHATTNYESNVNLKVGSGLRSFLRFDISAFSNGDRIVYDASLLMSPTATGGVTGGIAARRPTQALPAAGTLNWNNQPNVGSTDLDVVYSANAGTWWQWQLKELYQHIIDPTNAWNTHWDNNGVRLSASNAKTFYATEAAGTADPYLSLLWNDLPYGFNLDTPPTNYVTETESPTLRAMAIPGDPNGDDVMISFQISDDGVNWTGSHLVFASPYDDAKSFTVPAGVLIDGQDYWWRGVSRDVCQQPAQLCILTDGAGTNHTPNTSGVRKITVSLKHYGDDPRYAMWSHDVGSGMTLKVNEANGNAFLDVPLDSYSTPIGPLDVGLAYNHELASDYGLSPGWDVAIGPRSGHSALPVALYKLDTSANADVKIRFRGGRVAYFPHVDKNIYGGTSANSGWVRKAPTNWTYVDGDGGRYTFSLGAENAEGARLTKAKPSASQDSAPGKSIDYVYNGSGQLTSVTEPLGRKVVLQWISGKLTQITSSGGTAATSFSGEFPWENIWSLGYDANGRLATVDTTVADFQAGTGGSQILGFTYSTTPVAGKLQEIRDGRLFDLNATGWRIAYAIDPQGMGRVSTITAPPGGAPTTPTPWHFAYHSPYKGTTAAGACITDPRGTGGLPTDCDVEVLTDPPYQTQVEFSWAGLPIEVITPPDDAGVRSDTTYVFDNHSNLRCERDPVGNAWGNKHCTSATDANGNYTDLDPDGYSTSYSYFGQGPYRLKTVKHPAPTSGAPRLQEAYTYDSGGTFNGLWAEIYEVENLVDLPNDEYMWTDFNQDWGAGNPPGANGSDNFSIRLTGYLDVTDWTGARTAKFRVWAEDGVSLSVAGVNILDCFGQQETGTDFNCGSNTDVKKKITPPSSGLVPFEIEFSHLTGNASLELRWDGGNGGTFDVPAASRFKPNLGLVTNKTYQKVDGTTTDLWEETWSYPTDDFKARRLPQDSTQRILPSGTSYTTRTAYNSNGQPTTITENFGTTQAATTTNVWRNGTPPWNASWKVSCLERSTDPTGAATDFECDPAGDEITRIATVRAVANQAAQTRTTYTHHDTLGRPTLVVGPSGQESISVYDFAGRIVQTKQELTTGIYATTDLAYDYAGHLLTESLPDPDRAGTLSSPVITHRWNWADLETSTIDARGKTWTIAYDQISRSVSRTSPLGATSTTTYILEPSLNSVKTMAPSGSSVWTDFDLLGRKISEKLATYHNTTYNYDVLGNLTQTVDPAGITTKHNFNNLSELTSSVQFFGSASAATTSYSYDPAGRLSQVDGPRISPDPDDRITYGYDLDGRLTSSTYEGVTLPSSSTKASVTVTYDDAGQKVRVTQPLTTTTNMIRNWTNDLSGRVATYADARGTTIFTHNLAGWPTQIADPRPQTIFLGYDDLGRRICRHTSACDQTTAAAETYAYDAAGNVTQAKNSAVTFDMTYDDDGRLWKTFRNGSGTPETTYDYQASSAQLTSIVDAAGTTAFTYNAADQLLTVDDPFVTGTPVTTYTYEGAGTAGRLTTRTDAQANLRLERTYEAQTGRIDTQLIKNNTSGVTLASFDLGYDLAGNINSKASSVFSNPANGSWSYVYDGASRLTRATGPNATGASTTYDYAYDGGGNRILDKETTSTVVRNLTTTYDAAGLPTSASDSATGETITYAHDAIGDLNGIDSSIASNDWTYVSDAYARLTCAVQGTSCASGNTRVLFTMDPLDRALTRTKGSSVTSFTYQGVAESLAKTVNGATTTTYVYTGAGAALAEKTGSTASFYLRDLHGDIVGLTSTSAANQGTSSFNPWGKSLAKTGQSSFLGYQGDMTDPDTTQVDMGTRWYASGLGRFISRDMIAGTMVHPTSLNQHVYGGLNPVTMWDPTGMKQTAGGGSGGCGSMGMAECMAYNEETYHIVHPSSPPHVSPHPAIPSPEPPEPSHAAIWEADVTGALGDTWMATPDDTSDAEVFEWLLSLLGTNPIRGQGGAYPGTQGSESSLTGTMPTVTSSLEVLRRGESGWTVDVTSWVVPQGSTSVVAVTYEVVATNGNVLFKDAEVPSYQSPYTRGLPRPAGETTWHANTAIPASIGKPKAVTTTVWVQWPGPNTELSGIYLAGLNQVTGG
jgi:RHS repeat-associated protein